MRDAIDMDISDEKSPSADIPYTTSKSKDESLTPCFSVPLENSISASNDSNTKSPKPQKHAANRAAAKPRKRAAPPVRKLPAAQKASTAASDNEAEKDARPWQTVRRNKPRPRKRRHSFTYNTTERFVSQIKTREALAREEAQTAGKATTPKATIITPEPK